MSAVVLITGTRYASAIHLPVIRDTLRPLLQEFGWSVTVREGEGPGLDQLAAIVARELGWAVDPHPAAWAECGPLCPSRPHRRTRRIRGTTDMYCPLAGHRRNQQAEPRPVEAFGFPVIGSAGKGGTWDCLARAADAGIPCHIRPLDVPHLATRGGVRRASRREEQATTQPLPLEMPDAAA